MSMVSSQATLESSEVTTRLAWQHGQFNEGRRSGRHLFRVSGRKKLKIAAITVKLAHQRNVITSFYLGLGRVTGFSMWYNGLGRVTGFSMWYNGLGRVTGFSMWYNGLGRVTGFSMWYNGLGRVWGIGCGIMG